MNTVNNVATISEQQNAVGNLLINAPEFHTEHIVPRWYAVYTSANHEKRVAEQLSERQIESFLPLYESARRWKDRRVVLQSPLFPGYVFVRVSLRDRLRVVQIPGIAKLVGFGGIPTPLSEQEITSLQKSCVNGFNVRPHPFLNVGQRVRIKAGVLAGATGILLRHRGKTRIVMSLELLRQAVIVELVDADIECMDR